MQKNKTKSRGKRYSAAEIEKVLNYARAVDKDKGRGGIAAASRRFHVSPLTVSKWMKDNGAKPAKRATRRKAAGSISHDLRELADIEDKRERLVAKIGLRYERG